MEKTKLTLNDLAILKQSLRVTMNAVATFSAMKPKEETDGVTDGMIMLFSKLTFMELELQSESK